MHAAVYTTIRAALEEPALLFLLSLIPCLIILQATRASDAAMRRIAMLSGAVCVLAVAALGILNLRKPGFIWHDEASILSVAAAYLHGEPIYHARSGPALYSLLYGPLTFLAYVPLLRATAHPLELIRWAGLAVYLGDAALLYSILRSRVSAWIALGLLVLPLAILLSSASHAFGIRGDLTLLLCLCVGVKSIQLRSWPAAALLCGLASGLAVDFKLTVLPTVVLLLALLFRRHRLQALLLSSATTLLVAAAPFLLPRVSMKNYLSWLVLSSHQGLDPVLLRTNLLCAAWMLAPAMLLRIASSRDQPATRHQDPIWIGVLFLAALACAILTGSKNGAGLWHLWPILPFAAMWLAYEAARSGRNPSAAKPNIAAVPIVVVPIMLAALAIASSLVLLRLAYRDLRIIHPADPARQIQNEHGAEAELTNTVFSNPDSNIEMGYGSDVADYRSSLRFELPLHKQLYTLDEDAFVELIKAGSMPSLAVIDHVLGCDSLWLIPHGDAPFETLRKGVLPDTTTQYLFPDDLRLHFAKTHALIKSGAYYDLWACPDAVGYLRK